MVFSAKEAEYKELVERRDMMELYPALQTSLTPDGMRNFNKYVFFPKFLQDPQLIDTLFPDSIDEIKATEENEMLGENSMPQVQPTDNHEQHLLIHRMSKNSWAKWVHIQWHEELLSMQKLQEMNAMSQQMQAGGEEQKAGKTAENKPNQPTQGAQQPMQPQVGAAKQKPQEAAASLRQETLTSIGQQNNKM